MACIHLVEGINKANSTYQGLLICNFLSQPNTFANKMSTLYSSILYQQLLIWSYCQKGKLF